MKTSRDWKTKNAGHGWFSSWMVTIFPSMILLIKNNTYLYLSQFLVRNIVCRRPSSCSRCIASSPSRHRVAALSRCIVAPHHRAVVVVPSLSCRCCRAAVALRRCVIAPRRRVIASSRYCAIVVAPSSLRRVITSPRRVVALSRCCPASLHGVVALHRHTVVVVQPSHCVVALLRRVVAPHCRSVVIVKPLHHVVSSLRCVIASSRCCAIVVAPSLSRRILTSLCCVVAPHRRAAVALRHRVVALHRRAIVVV